MGRRAKPSLERQLSLAGRWIGGFHTLAAGGGGRRPGAGEHRGADLDAAGDTAGKLSARREGGRRESTTRCPAPCAQHPAPAALRPEPCLRPGRRGRWSWKVGVSRPGAQLQPAPGSALGGPSSNSAPPGWRQPRDWGSGAPPSSLPRRPSAFLRPYRV